MIAMAGKGGKVKGAGLFNSLNVAHVERMAEAGMTRAQIGDYYGVTGQRIGQLIREHPELDAAFSRGLSKGIEKASSKLMEMIEGGNLIATIFYLKAQAGWKEAQYVKEPIDLSNAPRVQILLPDNGRTVVFSENMDDEIE